jgi:predicted signal transduction protein with EAL and GGDEF domain
VSTLVLQTIVGAAVVLVVGVVLLRRRNTLRAQGEDADPRALAGIENRVRILAVLAIFFVLWSVVRFTPS